MDKLVIQGGKKLSGSVRISGAKNAALPLMTASLLASGTHHFHNTPQLHDIHTMAKLLSHLGMKVEHENHSLKITHEEITAIDAPYDLVRTMRASVLVLGPLVAKMRHAKVSLPGGCAIGARPIDLHLKALEQMGAVVTLHDGYVEVTAENLHGAHIFFDKITVTGTENIMMTASLAPGTTVLENAAREPEVVDLANYLIKMGAQIKGAGTDRITIEGVKELKASEHSVIPDRIETGTFMIAAGMTGSTITLTHACPEFLTTFMHKLEEAGFHFKVNGSSIEVKAPAKPASVNISTEAHPAFATDLQAQFMALMSLSSGTSRITENIFENRFMHIAELQRLGAQINIEGNCAIVTGVEELRGAPVMATDLRASACLVLAALAAQGKTEVLRIYHLDRGYEHMEQKLREVGAQIERVKT